MTQKCLLMTKFNMASKFNPTRTLALRNSDLRMTHENTIINQNGVMTGNSIWRQNRGKKKCQTKSNGEKRLHRIPYITIRPMYFLASKAFISAQKSKFLAYLHRFDVLFSGVKAE